MGWARTLFLGDSGNRLDISDCEKEIKSLRRRFNVKHDCDRHQDIRIQTLEIENSELKLYLATIIRLLIAKEVFTKNEFARFVDIIDLSDGERDGQYDGDIV